MRGIAVFSDLVHSVGTDLHLNPLAVLTHYRHMQSLISVRLRRRDPVADTLRVRTVDLRDRRVNHPALVFLAHRLVRREDDTHRHQIIDILKRALLAHHFLPNGVNRFDSLLHRERITHTCQPFADRSREDLIVLQLAGFNLLQLVVNLFPSLGVLVFETQVLQLRLDREKTQTVRQRRVDILRFAGNLILLVLALRTQGAHVMKPIGNLNQYHADIIADSQQ